MNPAIILSLDEEFDIQLVPLRVNPEAHEEQFEEEVQFPHEFGHIWQ